MVYSLFDTGRPTLFEMNKKEVYDFLPNETIPRAILTF